MTVEFGRVEGDAGPKRCLRRVHPGSPDALYVRGPGDDPLGEEKAGRQVHVVARGPHRHGDRGRRSVRGLGRQADLQRFLHRELVGRGHAFRPGHSPHFDARDTRSVADLDHDSDPDGVISRTTRFIIGRSLYGKLTRSIDNHGADR